jgi:hypothetical protein
MPRKEFEGFTRLDASDVNTYLMDQSVMSFAGTAARGSAIATPVEGMAAYLEDSNLVSIYDGSDWKNSLGVTGGILQVVSTTKTDTFSVASTTFTEITNLTATITPKSTSSKILIMTAINTGTDQNSVATMHRLMRDTTPIAVGDSAGSRIQSTTLRIASSTNTLSVLSSYQFLDSPSTTSPVKYSVQLRGENATTFYVNRTITDTDNTNFARSSSTITLMEVAG